MEKKTENRLVRIKGKDVFTDTFVIAEGTKVKHESVKKLLLTYEKQFLEFGTFRILNQESTGGRPEQYYELNEQQATFLITLLRNNDIVVRFKVELVKEFYRMRCFILEKQTSEWQQARENGKTVRLQETDEIKRYVEYCRENGSSNAEHYYTSITKLVNGAVGISSKQRNEASCETLQITSILENTVRRTIVDELQKGTEYHEIYYICKRKVTEMMKLIYLPEERLLTAEIKGGA